MKSTIITIQWIDYDGYETITRVRSEYDAVIFEESLDAQGLAHHRS